MSKWIDEVFVDGKLYRGGMAVNCLEDTKRRFRESALSILNSHEADHVLYCNIEYDDDGEIACARFYTGHIMNDDNFYNSTGALTGDFYIGAVHKRQ